VRVGEDPNAGVPGNLLFFEGDVISQTVTDIRAYPQVDVKMALITERLGKNPKDPVGLTERGEMHLDKGEWQLAADDLHLALANKPPTDVLPKTRAKLFEALTELLNRDFSRNEQFLDEYEELCSVAISPSTLPEDRLRLQEEHQQRLATFLALKAKGREAQGRLVDAFDAYRKFGTLNGNRELIASVDDASIHVRPDLWAQERIVAMLAKAKQAERAPLEERIAGQYARAKASNDPEELRRFVSVFGVRSSYGQEAMLALAERRMQDPEGFLEAELLLLQLRADAGAPIAARAIDALARAMIRRNLMEDAAYYYRLLDREYPSMVVRDGRTGSDLYNELATDKRFWAYLDEPRQPWAGKRLHAKLESGNFPQSTPQAFRFEPEGEVLPFFQHNLLEVVNNSTLRLIDRFTSQVRFEQTNLATVMTNYFYNGMSNARFPYQVQGHLMVYTHGHLVYGFDPIGHKMLWQKNLYGTGTPNPQQQPSMSVDKDGTLELIYPGGFRMRLGRCGPVEPSYVCLQTRSGLMAIDPLNGDVLWKRSGIAGNVRLFGDADNVYMVEVQQDGSLSSTQTFRARDGVSVQKVTDFSKAYEHRIQMVGSRILVNDTEGDGNVAIRLYDVPTGKDVWKRTFSPKAHVITAESLDVVGVVEPSRDNRATVFDLRTQKDVLVTRLMDKDLDKVAEGGFHLLEDDDHYYLTVNKPQDGNNNPWGGPWSALNGNMRCVPLTGRIYAYHRDTGKVDWWADLSNQMLILDHFREMPVLLFASRYNKVINMKGGMRRIQTETAVVCLDKRTGKLLYEPPPDDNTMNNGQMFYALNVDPNAGIVELVSWQMKVRVEVDTRPAKGRKVLHTNAGSRTNSRLALEEAALRDPIVTTVIVRDRRR